MFNGILLPITQDPNSLCEVEILEIPEKYSDIFKKKQRIFFSTNDFKKIVIFGSSENIGIISISNIQAIIKITIDNKNKKAH